MMEQEHIDANKQRLFVDMDGTLAVFTPVDQLETLYQEGYFRNLKPHNNVVEAVKYIINNHPEIEVHILSAYLTDSKYALQEKNEWLDENLPEIDQAHRIFGPCGSDKKEWIPGGIREADHLLDDYTKNLNDWEPPARGIKLLNSINHTRGSWQHDRIRYDRTPGSLAEGIVGIMQGRQHIFDERITPYTELKIQNQVLSYYSGQMNAELSAVGPDGEVFGYIKYAEYLEAPYIQYIEVAENHRRQGVATRLLRELQNFYEGKEIDWGMTTEDGSRLKEAITYVVEDIEVKALADRLSAAQKALQENESKLKELYEIEEPTQMQSIEIERLGAQWDALTDEIWKLDREIDGRSTEKIFIKMERENERSVSMEQEKTIVQFQSAVRSNYDGYVALSQFDRSRSWDANDYKLYLGKRENYDNQGNYDNSDNSLVFISNNRKIDSFLNGEGWVQSQQAMIDNGTFTAADYAEYAQLKEGVLKQFEASKIREVKFDIDMDMRDQGRESGTPFQYPDWAGQNRSYAERLEAVYWRDRKSDGEGVVTSYHREGSEIRLMEGMTAADVERSYARMREEYSGDDLPRLTEQDRAFITDLARYDLVYHGMASPILNAYGELTDAVYPSVRDIHGDVFTQLQPAAWGLEAADDVEPYRLVVLTSERYGDRNAPHNIAYNRPMSYEEYQDYREYPTAFLEGVYAGLGNAGMQPSNYYGHSPSVGDAIVILTPEGWAESYYVASAGFQQENNPDHVITPEQRRAARLGMTVRDEYDLLVKLSEGAKATGDQNLINTVEEQTMERLDFLYDEYRPIFNLAAVREVTIQQQDKLQILESWEEANNVENPIAAYADGMYHVNNEFVRAAVNGKPELSVGTYNRDFRILAGERLLSEINTRFERAAREFAETYPEYFRLHASPRSLGEQGQYDFFVQKYERVAGEPGAIPREIVYVGHSKDAIEVTNHLNAGSELGDYLQENFGLRRQLGMEPLSGEFTKQMLSDQNNELTDERTWRVDRVTRAMEAAGYSIDPIESSADRGIFNGDYGARMEFETVHAAEEWLEGVVFDDPEMSNAVEKIMHPERFLLDGLSHEDMVQLIFEYEIMHDIPATNDFIPQSDRMTAWNAEAAVAAAKPSYGENEIPVTENVIEERCREILTQESRENIHLAYNAIMEARVEGMGLVVAGLAGRLQEQAAKDMNRQDGPWGSWFARISHPDRPQDYIELDITGYSTRNSVIESASLVLNGNVHEQLEMDEMSFDDYGNEEGFDTGFAARVAGLALNFDPSITENYVLYAPAGWSEHSLDEHYRMLRDHGLDDMPNWDSYNARVRGEDENTNERSDNVAEQNRIKVAIESTDDHTDTGFHQELVDTDIRNEDGSFGKVKDFYRIVAINENGRIAAYDDRVFESSAEARAAVAELPGLELVIYDDLVHEAGDIMTQQTIDRISQQAKQQNAPQLTVLFKDEQNDIEAGINADGDLYLSGSGSGYNLPDTIENRRAIERDIERYTGQQVDLVGDMQEPELEEDNGNLSFYVAESMEFEMMGEYHDGLTLQEAFDVYERIPSERLNGGKGIGFNLQDGSIYSGNFAMLLGNEVQDYIINEIDHFRNSPLVQQAVQDFKAEYARRYAPEQTQEQAQQPSSFIAHYYVVEDIQNHGPLNIRRFENLNEALVAYGTLPSDKMKSLGIENTNPLPGSLDIIQCKDGADTLTNDWQKVVGWNNPEVVAAVAEITNGLEELRNFEPIPNHYYYPEFDLDGTADELFVQARNGYIESPEALAQVQEILSNPAEKKTEQAFYVGILKEIAEDKGDQPYVFAQMKKDILDGVHPEEVSLRDGLTLEVLRDGNDSVVIDLRDYSAEDDASFVGGHSMSQDEFLKMTAQEFTETVNSIYAYNMAIEERGQEEERFQEPLVDIHDFSYDDEGYLHFMVDADGHQLEGLYRVLDPANGEDMELVSIDYGDRHPIIERQWDRIADALYDAFYDRYNAMLDQRYERKDWLVQTMAAAGYVYNEQESRTGHHVFESAQGGIAFVNFEAATGWLNAQLENNAEVQQYLQGLVQKDVQEHGAVMPETMERIERVGFLYNEETGVVEIAALDADGVDRPIINIGNYECVKVDEWTEGNNRYLLGNSVEDNDFYYAMVNDSPISTFEYDEKPTREQVEDDFLNWEAQRAIDEHEAEFGADGRRAFPNLNEDEAVFRLDDNQYLYIQESAEGYDYTIYDADMKELDGGQFDDPYLNMAQVRTEILALHEMHPEKIERISIEEYEIIGYEAERRNQPLIYSENEAIVKLAERIDNFMYGYDYYNYADDVGIDLENRSEHRAHLANALENTEYSPMIDSFRNIIAEEEAAATPDTEVISQAKAILHDLTNLGEYQRNYAARQQETGEVRDPMVALAARLDSFAYDANREEWSQSWNREVDELAESLRNGDVEAAAQWVNSAERYLSATNDENQNGALLREAHDLSYTLQHLDQYQQFFNTEREPNAVVPIEEFKRDGRTLEGYQIPGRNIPYNTIGHSDRTAVFHAVQNFEEANNLPANQREIHNGTYEDKDFLYMGYDRHVGMSHRNDLSIQPYMERLTSMAEDKSKHISLLPLVAEVYYAQQNGLTHEQIDMILTDAESRQMPLDAIKNLRHACENGLTQEQIAVLIGEDSFAQEALMGYMADGGSIENATALKGCDVAQYYILSSHLNEGSFGPEMAQAIIQAGKDVKDWTMADFDRQRAELGENNVEHPKYRFSGMDFEFFTEYLAEAAAGDKSITPEMVRETMSQFVQQRDTNNLRKFIETSGGFHSFDTHREETKILGRSDALARLGDRIDQFFQEVMPYDYVGGNGKEIASQLERGNVEDFATLAAAIKAHKEDAQSRVVNPVSENQKEYDTFVIKVADDLLYSLEHLDQYQDFADREASLNAERPVREPSWELEDGTSIEKEAAQEGIAIPDEKKDPKELLNEQLQQGVQKVLNSENFKNWLDTSSKMFLNNYSFNNAMLVWLQKPDATHTMGYEQWKEYGRNVAKGAEGIKIFVPVIAYEKKDGDLWRMIKGKLQSQLKANPSTPIAAFRLGMSKLEITTDGSGLYGLRVDGKERGLKSEKEMQNFIKHNVLGKVPMYFTVGTVFDAKDTIVPEHLWVKKGFTKAEMVRDESGKPIKNRRGEYKIINTPERQAKFQPTLDMKVPEKDPAKMAILYDALKAVSERNGIHVYEKARAEDDTLKGGADGYFSRDFSDENPKGYIVMPKDLDPTKAVSVMLHEMSHSELHGDLTKLAQRMGEENIPSHMREVQAEAVAYVVGKNFGIESDISSFNYLAAYSKGFELQALSKSIEVIYKECRQLTTELKTELEVRGLNMDLSEREKAPMDKEAVQSLAKAYIGYALEQNDRIADIEKELPELAEQNVGKNNILAVVVAQGGNVQRQKEDVSLIQEKVTALEKADTFAGQKECIEQIEAAKNRVENYKKDFADLSVQFQDLTRSEQGLKDRFVADPMAAIESMKKDYPQLEQLTHAQTQYLAKSEYVSRELAPMLRTDPAQFAEKAYERASQIDKVASKNGMFVEVSFCEQWTDKPIVENGALMHPKVADTIVKQAEVQIRSLRAEAENVGDYFPYSKCAITIYQAQKGEITKSYQTRVDIGDGGQSSLTDFLKQTSNAKTFASDFEKATREKGAKEKILFNDTRKDIIAQEVTEKEAPLSDRAMTHEDWAQEIGTRKEAEQAEQGDQQQEQSGHKKSSHSLGKE